MRSARRSLVRILAFVRKELVEIARQPQLVVLLVLGPFLIVLLFGMGVSDRPPTVKAIFAAEDGRVLTLAQRFAATQRTLAVEAVTDDAGAALRRLEAGDVDLVVAFPNDALGRVADGHRAVMTVYHNLLDPLETQAIELTTRQVVAALNDEVSEILVESGQERLAAVEERAIAVVAEAEALRDDIEREAAAQAQERVEDLRAHLERLQTDYAIAAALPDALSRLGRPTEARAQAAVAVLRDLEEDLDRLEAEEGVDATDLPVADEIVQDARTLVATFEAVKSVAPEVLVAPFAARVFRVSRGVDGLADFYAPAVVALLAQHLLVTFLGLSVVREEALGTTDLFRVAPVSTTEIVVGKTLAYLLLGAGVTLILSALLVLALGVPLHGSVSVFAVSVAVMLAAFAALGLTLAVLARTEGQAVQAAMLLLLATIFFSGFVLTLRRFHPPLRAFSSLLPATHGIDLLRDVMLRGVTPWGPLARLGAIAVTLWVFSAWMLARRLRPR